MIIHFHLNVRVFNHFLTPEKLLYYSKLRRGMRQGFMSTRLSSCRRNMKLESCRRRWKHLEREHQEVGKWAQHMEGKRAIPHHQHLPVCGVLSGVSCHVTPALFFKWGSTATSERKSGIRNMSHFSVSGWVGTHFWLTNLCFLQCPTFKNFLSWGGPAS